MVVNTSAEAEARQRRIRNIQERRSSVMETAASVFEYGKCLHVPTIVYEIRKQKSSE